MTTATKTKKPSRILADAAKWIEEHGLAKGNFFKYRNGRVLWLDDDGDTIAKAKEKGCRACAMGALYIAAGEENYPEEIVNYFRQVTGEWHIPMWNDKPERTQAEVVDALKEAAKAARKDGK